MTRPIPPAATTAPEVLLETRGLVKEFRGFVAVNVTVSQPKSSMRSQLLSPKALSK